MIIQIEATVDREVTGWGESGPSMTAKIGLLHFRCSDKDMVVADVLSVCAAAVGILKKSDPKLGPKFLELLASFDESIKNLPFSDTSGFFKNQK